MIEIRNLTKRYGSFQALTDVNLTLEPGRIVGLIGANGAGKTTLMKCLLGYLKYNGNISINDLDPRRNRLDLMSQATYIPDVSILPGWHKVGDIIRFFSEVHPNFNVERFRKLFATSDLPEDRRISKLSKGMKAKLYLLLVLATDSRVLILDEPTLGLDIIYRKAFFETILSEYAADDRIIMISTHEVKEVESILTDVVFLAEGRIQLQASLDELQDRFIQLVLPKHDNLPDDLPEPVYQTELFGTRVCIYADVARERLEGFGDLSAPSLADVFMALNNGRKHQ